MDSSNLPVIGWREWVSFPELAIPGIKAKVDTGARSSALHTHDYEVYEDDAGNQMVRFHLHPLRDRDDPELTCQAPVSNIRSVKDSGGHAEDRPFVQTIVRIGPYEWPIEISLTNRESMKFRMLLGRSAIAGKFTVEPEQSYLAGPKLNNVYDT